MDQPDDILEPPAGSALAAWGLTALAAIAFWAFALAMATSYVRIEREQPPYHLTQIPYDTMVVLIGAAHCLVIRAILERVTHRRFWVQVAVATVVVVVAAAPFEYVMRGMTGLIFHDVTNGRLPPVTARILIPATVFWSAPFGVWAVGNLALLHDVEARRRERRLVEAQARAHEAQVRALRYQVNPHFLYNTLNSIAALILDRRNDTAEAMVIRLSDFFRSSLSQDPLVDATLAREIELQRLYLDIEEVRFADQLQVEVRLPRELEDALAPSLILQPLVENALKHGLRGPGQLMRLTITARADADRLTLEVADDGRGDGAPGGGTGVGLKNIERRLAARFQDQARLVVESTPAGFRAQVVLPLRFA